MPVAWRVMGVLGFEPRTSALSELRSSQLSYTRLFLDSATAWFVLTVEKGPWPFLPMKREGQTVFGLAPSDPKLSVRAIRDAAESELSATRG